jgi:hypothetical protein
VTNSAGAPKGSKTFKYSSFPLRLELLQSGIARHA